MKGIITKEGYLKIDRFDNGKRRGFRPVFCPHRMYRYTFCGEDCPLFGEQKVASGAWTLEICHGKVLKFETLTFEDFTEKG